MSFKKLIVCVLFPCLFGCGIRIGEKAPTNTIAYNGSGFNCVGEIPEHIKKYINDELNDAEISGFVSCLQRSFTSFSEKTHGHDSDKYTPDEIRRFLEAYFLSAKISDELLHQFMVIKQVLAGGTAVSISREELTDAIKVLEDIKGEAIRMRPHLKYLNSDLLAKQSVAGLGKHLDEAKDALKVSIQVLSKRVQKIQRPYQFADLLSFIKEFRKFVLWEQHFEHSKPAEKWVDFLSVSKELTVSPQHKESIQPDEWDPWVEAMSSWYVVYLQYQVGVKDKDLQRGPGLQNLIYLAQEILGSLKDAVSRQPSQTILYPQILKLTQSFLDLEWMPNTIRLSSIEEVAHVFFDRVFGSLNLPPEKRKSEGITLASINAMEGEFYRWGYVQENLEANYVQNAIQVSQITLVPDLTSHADSVILQVNPPAVQAPVANSVDWDEFIKTKQYLERPIFIDNYPRTFVVPASRLSQYGLNQGFYNLSAMNLLRSLTSLIYRGYSHNLTSSLWNATIQGPDLQECYANLRNLGIDTAVIDKRNEYAGTRAFVEGKLFTFVSTGLSTESAAKPSEMAFAETMEYLAFLYSGGVTAGDVFKDLTAKCPHGGKVDINGVDMIDRSCVQTELVYSLLNNFGNAPFLQTFLASMDLTTNLRFAKIAMEMGKTSESEKLWFEKNEMNTVAVALGYMENIMLRFDANENGILSRDELIQALPIFGGFIKKIAKDSMSRDLSADEVRGVFWYILDAKEIPATDPWHMALILKNEYFPPDLNLDRFQLTQVFQAIIGNLMALGNAKKPVVTRLPEGFIPMPCVQHLNRLSPSNCSGTGILRVIPEDDFGRRDNLFDIANPSMFD